MSQTMSLTEISHDFPALFHKIAEKDSPVVVTNRNRPRLVLVPWDVYQDQQQLQAEGAETRLQNLVQDMLGQAAVLHEAYRPVS
ncbi:MAG: type II toxin-antitoxin system Phd/YefM family antitoxin [Chloroflexota bacterium]